MTSAYEERQTRQWIKKMKEPHIYYGSCWWTVPPVMVRYTEENLKKWTTREIMLMHYYLTNRLDGYGHLTADDSIKHNCDLFRKVLRERGHDGVDNCIWNETFYNWGHREWRYTDSPVGNLKPKPEVTYIKIGF